MLNIMLFSFFMRIIHSHTHKSMFPLNAASSSSCVTAGACSGECYIERVKAYRELESWPLSYLATVPLAWLCYSTGFLKACFFNLCFKVNVFVVHFLLLFCSTYPMSLSHWHFGKASWGHFPRITLS